MKKWIIRKPEMYRAMREASFSPGIAATVLIVFFMLVVNYIVREIPASMIDFTYYASHPANNSREALQVMLNYATAPSTMLWALSLTVIMIGIVVLYVKRAEKRPLATIGLSRERIVPRFAVGYLLGFVLLILSAAWEAASRATAYTGFQPVALLFIPLYIIQASSEEILFRGYMLSSITAKTSVIRAVLLTSALFALLHVGDEDVEGGEGTGALGFRLGEPGAVVVGLQLGQVGERRAHPGIGAGALRGAHSDTACANTSEATRLRANAAASEGQR